jgi:hypothetical protein
MKGETRTDFSFMVQKTQSEHADGEVMIMIIITNLISEMRIGMNWLAIGIS